MKSKFLAAAAALTMCGIASAKTVALWPIEGDAGRFNGENLVNGNEPLAIAEGDEVVESDIGWNIPPNPDTELKLRDVSNVACARKGGSSLQFLYNGVSARHIARNKNFTVEGWVKINKLPDTSDGNTSGGKSLIVSANETTGFHRWALMFAVEQSGECSWQVWWQGGSDTKVKTYSGDAAIDGVTNTWIHVAVAHSVNAALTSETWKIYIDSELAFTRTVGTSAENMNETPKKLFNLGGRPSNSKRIAYASFDYWRISDAVLEPADLLNAGGAGAVVPPSKTIAFWPLDVNEDGTINTWDSLNGAPLASGFWKVPKWDYKFSEARPYTESAFAGNPPNANVDLGAGGNEGSVMFTKRKSALAVEGFGKYLTCTNDWTVEGWIMPQLLQRENGVATQGVIWGTRLNGESGWLFTLDHAADGKVKFVLFAEWKKADGQKSFVVNNVAASDDLRDWEREWRHVALVHKAGVDGGKATWTVYIDGVAVKTITDSSALMFDGNYGTNFGLGGRTGNGYTDRGFQGAMDCVRVCAGALEPQQFMCAENGAAANDVLALWPLNVSKGAYFKLTDVSGNGNHIVAYDGNFEDYLQAKAASRAERPTVTNPDRSEGFRGPKAGGGGAVVFRDAVNNTGARSCLVSEDRDMLEWMAGLEGWTFECYYNFTDSELENDKQQVIFAIPNGDGTICLRFFMRNVEGGRGWTISEGYHATIEDTTYAGTSWDEHEKGRWYHMAVVNRFEDELNAEQQVQKMSVWELFIDGVSKGVVKKRVTTPNAPRQRGFMVGGRSWTMDNSVRGMVCNVRVSRGALTPGEFLNAQPAVEPAAVKTLAYWPLDYSGDAVNVKSLMARAYDFDAGEGVDGAAETARGSVPRPDTSADLVGNAKANAGSVVVAESARMTTDLVGYALEFARSFTVEGWIRWRAGEAERDLILCAGGAGEPGVKVWIESVGGARKMRVRARGDYPSSVLADGFFDYDFAETEDVWCHVAVVRDADCGMWRLYVDGREGGVVRDYWRAGATDTFAVGAFELVGGAGGTAFDMWRVSDGALAPEAFLYDKVRGTVLIVR